MRLALAGFCLTLVAGIAAVESDLGPDAAAASRSAEGKRDVVLVASAFEGTIDVIDQRGLKRLERIDIAPDYRECISAATNPGEAGACVADNLLATQGTLILVDDLRVASDGRTLYVSRPSLGDVAAFNLRTEELLWRVETAGRHPDHLALSPNGARLVVSAKAADFAEVIDARSATIVGRFATGDSPHGNDFSEDGKLIYNGSMGRGTAADCGPSRCWLTVVDAETLAVEQVIEFDQGVRPFAVTRDGRRAYVQLTFLHGFVEYSLRRERVLGTAQLPLTAESTLLDPGADPRHSTNHGIALSRDETKICAAATASDYVAIVRRRSLSVKGIVAVGDQPAWAASSEDGRYCFVPNRESDDVSVITYDEPREVARIEAGDRPSRVRTARVRL